MPEDYLLESERRFRSVVQTATDAIVLADGSGNIIAWNRAAQIIFGYREEEVLGQPLTMVMPERYRDAHRKGLARLQAGGEARVIGTTVELHGIRKDGSEFPLELSIGTWQATEGAFYSGIIRDTTERKRAEKFQSAQLEVSLILAESTSLAKAAPLLLKTICHTVGWELGAIWLVDRKTDVLRCDTIWHLPSLEAREFVALSWKTEFPSGVGLPGRVWASGKPVWISDVVKDSNFPRAPMALKAGVHGAFCFPIRIWSNILGVIEFFSREVREPDGELLDMVTDIGIKIGNFIERKRNDEKREKLIHELQDALVKVKTLSGLLPICATCKKIRDDKGYWKQIEDYIADHSEAQFTHGICSDCARKIHPDWDET
jgi:PAS domain S-box-containing protein